MIKSGSFLLPKCAPEDQGVFSFPNALLRITYSRKDFIGSIPTTGKYCSSNAPWVAIHKAKTGLTLRSLGLQTVETPSLFGIVIGPMVPCLPIECQDYLPSQRVKKLLLKMLGIQLPMIGIFGQEGLSNERESAAWQAIKNSLPIKTGSVSPNKPNWIPESKGTYTTTSAKIAISEGYNSTPANQDQNYKNLWSSSIPPKCLFLVLFGYIEDAKAD
ncbi:hypothetical protein E6C27_scaffold285G001730 [Cucumis melo var. makuwa]|uniref:Uncharacterized protein n=1 Tax=Cucumis melo var. makuwa TaxID=1194695 RepID=A0A5A7SWW8_CUCMM|nr:hypothetical protein E6C27_scaffold285G001730 [Cucumis melo var. makuwa]